MALYRLLGGTCSRESSASPRPLTDFSDKFRSDKALDSQNTSEKYFDKN